MCVCVSVCMDKTNQTCRILSYGPDRCSEESGRDYAYVFFHPVFETVELGRYNNFRSFV